MGCPVAGVSGWAVLLLEWCPLSRIVAQLLQAVARPKKQPADAPNRCVTVKIPD